MKRTIIAAVASGAVLGGIVAGAVMRLPQANVGAVQQARGLPPRPGPDFFWENVPLSGRAEWRQRPAGWQDPIYPPLGLSPSNQW